jgi:hypothetical protein
MNGREAELEAIIDELRPRVNDELREKERLRQIESDLSH